MKNIALFSLLALGLVACDNTKETPVAEEPQAVDCSRAEPQQPGYPNECLDQETKTESTDVTTEPASETPSEEVTEVPEVAVTTPQ
jgi:hypothetical protein